MAYPTHETIQQAIDALPNGRGIVTLTEPLYIISAPINLPNNVHLRGQGAIATRLVVAEGANCDVIRCVHDPAVAPSYYYYSGVSDMAIYCNELSYANPNTIGNGIVLSYAMHFDLRNLYIVYAPEWAIKVLRSYWCSFRDIHIRAGANGVLIGGYDVNGTYTNGVPTRMIANSNAFDNVHIAESRSGAGIHIAAGRANVFVKCDTSACGVGLRLENEQECTVEHTQLYGHYFESNTVDIEQRGDDTQNTYLHHPIFKPDAAVITDETGTLYIL